MCGARPLGFISIAPITHLSGGRYCHKTTLFLDDELVAGEIYFEEMRDADGTALGILGMTVNRHHPLTIETLEKHTMTVSWRCDRIGLLNPWTI